MSRKQLLTAIQVASQTLPFLMITATFVGIAYACGPNFIPYHMDPSFEFLRLSYHYTP